MAKNRVIGANGEMPWHISEDLKRFKRITSGSPILMGRKTFESIGSRPLPKRLNIIISRQNLKLPDGVLAFSSIEAAIDHCASVQEEWGEEIFICGGGEIYRQTLEKVNRLYLTYVNGEYEGDAYYPEVDLAQFQKLLEERCEGSPSYTFVDYQRV
jgi:dihydrofolate reductase